MKGYRISFATKFFHRAQGLLGKPTEEILLIAPCCDIHTFGMRYGIDVAFVDCCGVVISASKGVAPWRRVRESKACAVLERKATDAQWFSVGDRLAITLLEEEEGH